jgi:hypothetical protein
MRNHRSFTFAAIATLVAASFIIASSADAQQRRRATVQVGAGCTGGLQALFDEIEAGFLSTADEADISLLREEEKLARDVYLTLAERWQLPIFANIARAEQKHMDLVLKLIETYGLVDSITDDTVGAFNDGFLAQSYIDFVADGDISLVAALAVGVEIEDMDLADLYAIIENTENAHLRLVAYNLAKGSRNHLRAFMRALEAQGGTYTPGDHLDEESFNAVFEADMERSMFYDSDGEPVAACGGSAGGFGVRRGQVRRGGQGDGSGNGSQGNDNGNGECSGDGSSECDGTGPHGGGNGNSNGSGSGGSNGTGNGSGECDGTGPNGGTNGGGGGD